MKKRHTLRLLACLLALCICAAPLSALAALPDETPISPFYIGVATVTRSINVSSSGCATCYGRIVVRSGYTIDMELELQVSSDDETWSTIKSWTSSGSGTMTLDKIYFVSSGYYYRVLCTAEVFDGDGNYVEGISAASGSQYY